jgi:hypothetical protein
MMTKAVKLLPIAMFCVPIALLSACGGGGGTPGPTSYQVSATAGAGGTISPASAIVNAGGTSTFTVTANSGYATSGVTGCGGTLSGNTYTTGAINGACTVTANFIAQYTVTAAAAAGGTVSPASATVNVALNSGYAISSITGCGGSLTGDTYTTGTINANCTVAVSFSAAFTWVSGSNTVDANGVYGTQGVAAPGNVPGARHGPITWTDAAGDLWAYGGYGVGDPIFGDLWKYSPSSGQWTWVGGSSTPNTTAVYGTLGVAAETNTPGANGAAAYSWTDASGNVWVFGGYGYDSTGTRGWLNALWEYSPASGMWTWQGGSTTISAWGIYGTKGVAAATNYPGARAGGGFKDTSGNVWLFGGAGYDSTGALGSLNDLWEYSPSSGQWTWVSGSNTVNAKGFSALKVSLP